MIRSMPFLIVVISMTVALTIMLILATASLEIPNIYAQNQLQNASGWGQSVLPGGIPTLFSFKAIKQDGAVSGNFECFAVMPDGNTMYVKGTVTNLTISANGTSVIISGPTTVTGFGAGAGTFNAVASQTGLKDGSRENGTLILTTDVNGDGIQGNMPDGSEGPFNEKILKGSIKLGS